MKMKMKSTTQQSSFLPPPPFIRFFSGGSGRKTTRPLRINRCTVDRQWCLLTAQLSHLIFRLFFPPSHPSLSSPSAPLSSLGPAKAGCVSCRPLLTSFKFKLMGASTHSPAASPSLPSSPPLRPSLFFLSSSHCAAFFHPPPPPYFSLRVHLPWSMSRMQRDGRCLVLCLWGDDLYRAASVELTSRGKKNTLIAFCKLPIQVVKRAVHAAKSAYQETFI